MKVLVVPGYGLGDNLLMLPLAFNLKNSGYEVHFLSSNINGSSEILNNSPYVDKIIPFELKDYSYGSLFWFICTKLFPLKRLLFRESYDFVLSTNPNFLRNLIMMGNKKIVINNKNKNAYLLNSDILTKLGINEMSVDTDLLKFIREEENFVLNKFSLSSNKYALVNFFGSSTFRSLSNKESSQILKLLKERAIENVVLIGQTTRTVDSLGYTNLINKTTIRDLAILIKNSKLLVTVDSGPMHFGIIQNKPILAIFKVVNSKFFKPLNSDYLYFKTIDLLDENNSIENIKVNERNSKELSFLQINSLVAEIKKQNE